jgi:outer membrane protein OmpA-like peptidoglycan-associated protein/DNA-directed RNA polymerase subunit N (RpoN/RPB10)
VAAKLLKPIFKGGPIYKVEEPMRAKKIRFNLAIDFLRKGQKMNLGFPGCLKNLPRQHRHSRKATPPAASRRLVDFSLRYFLKNRMAGKSAFLFYILYICVQSHTLAASLMAPAYDDCSKAFILKDVTNWCSSPRQFTNAGAGASGLDGPGCFPSFLLDADNDVWFKFTAVATTVNISVIGAIKNNSGGTLQMPQFALYRGSCSKGLVEIACISDAQGYNIVETFVNNITVGQSYYLRVDARNSRTGTFQLCVNNFNPVPSPSSDCATAVVLCDKSPFTVPSVTGAGLNRFEFSRGLCVPEESQSAWYKWTCESSGPLTFTLSPINPSDDLDFVLFWLPNGVSDCSMKVPIRCMASGENVSDSYANWKRCTGSTGLRSKSSDIIEEQGCQEFDDNFLAPLQMEAGKSYALVVNNYHNTGNGFSVEFGGTGSFVGPKAHFTVSKLKVPQGEELWIKNASSFPGGIKKWEWNFGVDAKPESAKGAGPHKVVYSSTGKKSISLSIETANGCKVTKVREVQVVAPPPPPPPPPPVVEDTIPAPTVAASTREEEKEEEVEIEPEKIEAPVVAHSRAHNSEATPPPPPKADTVYKNVEYLAEYMATIYYRADSFNLEEKDKVVLDEIIAYLTKDPEYIAIVEGHTNSIPSDDYCNKLAAKRADQVIAFLKSQGIQEQRIIKKIYGKNKTAVTDEKYPLRRRNQRALVKVVKRKE